MKEKILKLRIEGKSYGQIKDILGCSKSTISYYCGDNQKEKLKSRTKKYRSENYLNTKVDQFKFSNRKFKDGVRDFQRRSGGKLLKKSENNFTYQQVLEKFGRNTYCYLTGTKIDLLVDNNYQLDHILRPKSGGKNNIDNMGILCKEVNKLKANMTIAELIYWCEKIVIFHKKEKGSVA